MGDSQELAEKVVARFKASLSPNALVHVSDAEFNRLGSIVREALSEELAEVTEMLEGVLRKLRARTEKPELGM